MIFDLVQIGYYERFPQEFLAEFKNFEQILDQKARVIVK
jgi:hypothetical protein